MSDSTERFTLPFIQPGQAQKEMFHNEALTAIDMLLHPAIEGAGSDAPPGAPDAGQCWIVGTSPSGAWEDHGRAVAMWTDSGWRFAPPAPGMAVWDKSAGHGLYWDGTDWNSGLAVSLLTIGGVQVVGERQPSIATPSGGTVIDAEARSALDQVIATLMTHGLID